MIFNHVPQEVLIEGDMLVVHGKREDLTALKAKLQSAPTLREDA